MPPLEVVPTTFFMMSNQCYFASDYSGDAVTLKRQKWYPAYGNPAPANPKAFPPVDFQGLSYNMWYLGEIGWVDKSREGMYSFGCPVFLSSIMSSCPRNTVVWACLLLLLITNY